MPERLWVGPGPDPEKKIVVVQKKSRALGREDPVDLDRLRELARKLAALRTSSDLPSGMGGLIDELVRDIEGLEKTTDHEDDEAAQRETAEKICRAMTELRRGPTNLKAAKARVASAVSQAKARARDSGAAALERLMLPLEEGRLRSGLADMQVIRKALDERSGLSREAFDRLAEFARKRRPSHD
jgi:hypothetical protein